MSVTEASLQILKCSLCAESLSVFPISLIINLKTKTSKNICGRCPTVEGKDEVTTQNVMYEALAEHTIFSCLYKPNGCRERTIPAGMSKHEMFCAHKPIFCPHTPLDSCAWRGNKRELLEHFNDKHRFLIIQDCITEIDIVTKQQENYLMQVNQDLYIVHFECDGDDDTLKVNLRIIGTENSRNRFQYYLSFYHLAGESTDTETNIVELFDIDHPRRSLSTSASTCMVQISDLMTALNDPSTIRCHIVITPSKIVSLMDTDVESSVAGGGDGDISSNSFSQINEADLQSRLECPVCLSHFKAPVLQCVEGHSLCESCRPAAGTCPECRSAFAVTRNYTLEKILALTPFNCKNDQFGCKYKGIPAELNKHEPNCLYCRACPLTDSRDNTDCPWLGNMFDILQHCRALHNDNIIDIDLITYYFPDRGEDEHQTYLLHRYQQLFTLHLYCDRQANCYWRVQWIGAAVRIGATKAKYAYEVCLVTENSCRINMQKPIETVFLSRDRMFTFDEEFRYIKIPNYQLRPFCVVEGAIEFSINVHPL